MHDLKKGEKSLKNEIRPELQFINGLKLPLKVELGYELEHKFASILQNI